MNTEPLKDKCLAALHEIEELPEVMELPGVKRQVDCFYQRLQDEEFRIAVVGEFSSGKSTFINALIGKDVLSHATKETTAVLTRIVNIPQQDPRNQTGNVFLSNGIIVSLKNLQELKEYTTTFSQNHQVVEEIREVEIYLPVFDNAKKIVVVDTPGLNGMADGHREKTVGLIQRANACIYMLQSRGITESDVEFLKYLANYQHHFIFVQNFIDQLKEIEGETVESKLSVQKSILKEKVFCEFPQADYQVCGVSSLLALAAQDRRVKITGDRMGPLPKQNEESLYQQSNFPQLQVLLNDYFRDDRLDEIRYGDTSRAIESCLNHLDEPLRQKRDRVTEVYLASKDRLAAEKLENLRGKIEKNRDQQKKQLTDFVISKSASIQKELTDSLKKEMQSCYEQLRDDVEQNCNIQELDLFCKNLQETIREKVDLLVNNHKERYAWSMQEQYQKLMARIAEYSGISGEEYEASLIQLEELEPQKEAFQQEQTNIERLQEQYRENTAKLEKLKIMLVQQQSQLKKTCREKEDVEGKQKQSIKREEEELSLKGNRPLPEEKRKPVTNYRSRGGFGILDFIFGKEAYTDWEKYSDDSNVKKWDYEVAEIKNRYAVVQFDLKRDLAKISKKIHTIKQEEEDNRKELDRVEERNKRCLLRLENERKTLEVKKKHAADDYLKGCKERLSRQIESYLLGEDGVETKVMQNLEKNMDKAKKQFIQEAQEQFDQAIQQKMEWIDQAKQQAGSELTKQLEQLDLTIKQIADIREKLGVVL